MKQILKYEFDMPEDREEFITLTMAVENARCIENIRTVLRNCWKYNTYETKEQLEAAIRECIPQERV